jgi:hypothetical protein
MATTIPDSTQAGLPQPITDVPAASVGQVVQRFISFDNVKQLQITIQPDGKLFTITPEHPETGAAHSA